MSHLAIRNGNPVRIQPFPAWPVVDQNDERALLDVLRSGTWGRHQGKQTLAFEAAFAEYCQTRFCIGVVNGTVALRLAILAAGLEAGDEVIVPPYTFISTASAVLEANGVPVFVDIDPDTYNLDPAQIEAAITPRTRAIIPVHFAGLPCDMARINAIASRHKLVVIEDAAHAHGAEFQGRRAGGLGDIGCFSFQASKTLTSGEGGAITTSAEGYERIARSLHTVGRFPGGQWYEHHLIGGNYRMSEFQGGLLLSQLARLDEQIERRERNAQYLDERLSAIPGIRPLKRGVGETRHGYYLYMFRYDAQRFKQAARARFIEALRAEGIPAAVGYEQPLYRQPLFSQRNFGPFTGWTQERRDYDYATLNLPVTEQACREGCWLPHNVLLGSLEDMEDVARAFEKLSLHAGELV